MKICYFVTKFPYSQQFKEYVYGGASVAAYYLAIEMAKRSNDIDVCTTSIDSKDCIEKNGSMTIYRYGTNLKILTSNISFGMFTEPIKHNADVIHTHFDIAPGPFAGLRFARKKNIPFIITYHGDWVDDFGGLIRRIGVRIHNKYLVEKILSHADVIISPSYHYINESIFLGKYREKIVVIPNGINLKEFDIQYTKEECREKLGIPIDKNVLLFFSYLSPYKGPDVLLKAIPNIIKENHDIEIVIAGNGVMMDELKNLSKKLGIEKWVRFAGFISDDMKPVYFKASDIFILPSTMKTESFGIVNLEAMACSIPIVASNIGGIPDVVKNGENGLLVQPKDPEALANSIIKLLNNIDFAKKMGKNGRKLVEEKYSWEKIAEMTEKIYNEVLS